MAIPRADLIAGLADHWYRRGRAEPTWRRREIANVLAEASPMFRAWYLWERVFSPLYLAGVTCQLAGILALALDARPLLIAGLVLTGTITNAPPAVHLWRIAGQALDIATGLVSSGTRE